MVKFTLGRNATDDYIGALIISDLGLDPKSRFYELYNLSTSTSSEEIKYKCNK